MSSSSRDILEQGHYARKQIFSRNRIVGWSHRRRFAVARELVHHQAGGALLDYGCGDGTFIALSHDLFRMSLGADVDPGQVRDCAERFAPITDVRFATTDALRAPDHDDSYDAVVCMEVLEHCPSDVQPVVLEDLARLSRPGGTVVISVPIEVGPTLAVKQLVRAAAAASGLSEYAGRERYRPSEFLRMVLADERAEIERPAWTGIAAGGVPFRFHGHKGFNWRRLERLIARVFTIERRDYSPVRATGAFLNSQVWFVCRRR